MEKRKGLSPVTLFTQVVLFLLIMNNSLFAETVKITGVGEYVMGDNDTYTEAKKLALQDAKRIILEKVGTYIESKTEVKEGVVSSDEIKQYTAGIVKVEEIGEERSVLANKATVVKVNVNAMVDTDVVIKQIIGFRNRKDIEESAKKMSIENNNLRKEIEQLNQQLKNVVSEDTYRQLRTQREEILNKIDSNEKGLTLILSGEELYTAALIDRQNKNDAKEIVKRFLNVITSAYKLSVSPAKVEDNGNGTANVIFKVNMELPFSLKPFDARSPIESEISRIPGLNLTEFWSTGLRIAMWGNNDIQVICGENKCQEAIDFMTQELGSKPLFLYMTLGKYTSKEELSKSIKRSRSNRYSTGQPSCRFPVKSNKEFKIKVSPSELKLLSQLEVKVKYLDK